MAVGDQADGESEECSVDVVASLPADAQAAETAEPGGGAPDDVAEDAQTDAAGLGTRALSRIATPIAARLLMGSAEGAAWPSLYAATSPHVPSSRFIGAGG